MPKMPKQEIEKKLLVLVQEVLPPDPTRPPLSRATRLLDDPAIDSLTLASLGFSINGAFGISTEDIVPMLPGFQTVGDALALIEANLNRSGK